MIESDFSPTSDITKVYSHLKVKQPFEMLPSFAVAAEVLSFVDYMDGVKYRLIRLSQTTRLYFSGHNKILKTFLV